MFGNYSIDRMVARAKLNDLRQNAQARRLSKQVLGERRNGSLQRWVKGFQRVVKSILP